MQTNKHQNLLTALLLLFGCLMTQGTLLSVSTVTNFNNSSRCDHSAAQQPVKPTAELDTHWRYTRYGWQDSSIWKRTPADLGPRIVDRINPVLFSIDVILAALGAMILASDNWQVDRLLGRKSRRVVRRSFDDLARKARIRRVQGDS